MSTPTTSQDPHEPTPPERPTPAGGACSDPSGCALFAYLVLVVPTTHTVLRFFTRPDLVGQKEADDLAMLWTFPTLMVLPLFLAAPFAAVVAARKAARRHTQFQHEFLDEVLRGWGYVHFVYAILTFLAWGAVLIIIAVVLLREWWQAMDG